MNDLDKILAEINNRLKVGRMGLQIELRGVDQWISIRGTFPARPGSPKTTPFQQRIPLGMRGSKQNLIQAEKLARQIRVELDGNKFKWNQWLICEGDSDKFYFTDKLLERLEESYFINNPETLQSRTTWNKNYKNFYLKFPSEPIEERVIIQWIKSQKIGGQRNKTLSAARHLCKVLKIKIDFSKEITASEKKSFRKTMLTPRDLPTDQEIVEIRNSITDPSWQWVFGLMATYGLRNHEVVGLNFDHYPDLVVRESAKTGMRTVIPIYPEWAELWKLNEGELPPNNTWNLELGNDKLGKKITKWFADNGLPINPYDLRHCYAVRTVQLMDERIAAKLMGHSVTVHQQTYQFWANEKVYTNAAKQAIENKKGLIKVPGVD